MTRSNPRIFVQIPSYRDTQCQWTVKDMFDKAAYPERIFVGICWQYDAVEDQGCFEVAPPLPDNVRTIEFSHRESQGLGWARCQAQKLARDEEYTLQIDAHMRFAQDWDQILLEMIESCPGERNILSHYPPSFIPPDRYVTDSIPYMYPARFNDAGIPMEKSFSFATATAPARPVLNYFVAGGLIFAPSAFFTEVPPDPHIYFWGEQIGTAVRGWTRGWNIYSPNRNSIYHIYHGESQRPLNWQDNPDWVAKAEKTGARIQYLLGCRDELPDSAAQDLDRLSLGTARDLAEYEQLTGISFRSRTLSPQVIDGAIERLRRAGGDAAVESSASWYRSLFVIDQIAYDTDSSRVSQLIETYLATEGKNDHRLTVCLHYARHLLDRSRIAEAERLAFTALQEYPNKANCYNLVALVYLRQNQYDSALAMLMAARQLGTEKEFKAIFPAEPHPLTLMALVYCKRGQPQQAVDCARQALALDPAHAGAIQAILDDADNPVGKELWLFRDKQANFKQYQAKDDIDEAWKQWARDNAARMANRRTLSLRIQEVGFRKELVETFLDTLFSPAN